MGLGEQNERRVPARRIESLRIVPELDEHFLNDLLGDAGVPEQALCEREGRPACRR